MHNFVSVAVKNSNYNKCIQTDSPVRTTCKTKKPTAQFATTARLLIRVSCGSLGVFILITIVAMFRLILVLHAFLVSVMVS